MLCCVGSSASVTCLISFWSNQNSKILVLLLVAAANFRHSFLRCHRILIIAVFIPMKTSHLQNLHPFSQILKIFQCIGASIIVICLHRLHDLLIYRVFNNDCTPPPQPKPLTKLFLHYNSLNKIT